LLIFHFELAFSPSIAASSLLTFFADCRHTLMLFAAFSDFLIFFLLRHFRHVA